MADASLVRVKICGVTNWADAKLAVDLGADALGFNFHAPSPRAVTPAQAWEIIRRLPPMVTAVGVFVNWPARAVAALARALRLGAVQLHGDEPPGEVRELAGAFSVIKAFPVPPGFRLATLAPYSAASALLLDGFKDGLARRHGAHCRLGSSAARAALRARDSGGRHPAWRMWPRPSRACSRTRWTWPAESRRVRGRRTRARCVN